VVHGITPERFMELALSARISLNPGLRPFWPDSWTHCAQRTTFPCKQRFEHRRFQPMADDYPTTVRIRRPRVTTDDRGRSVWADTVETAELELVSTAELKKILASSDAVSLSAIEKVATGTHEGVLARDPATGLFEIISDSDLQAILAENEHLPKALKPADVTLEPIRQASQPAEEELSLVSTQVLRKVLARDVPKAQAKKPSSVRKPSPSKKDAGGGFDPYNSG
jgi:hypothetical protein